MTVVTFVLTWLALSLMATLAYAFGASVGYRRAVEEATPPQTRSRASANVAPSSGAAEVRLPEDAERPT